MPELLEKPSVLKSPAMDVVRPGHMNVFTPPAIWPPLFTLPRRMPANWGKVALLTLSLVVHAAVLAGIASGKSTVVADAAPLLVTLRTIVVPPIAQAPAVPDSRSSPRAQQDVPPKASSLPPRHRDLIPKPSPSSALLPSPIPAPQRVSTSATSAVTKNDTEPMPRAPDADPVSAASPPAPVLSATPSAVVPARFDADYLRNPAPAYPAAARRSQEEGKVVLKVNVSAQGEPVEVLVESSSGYPRLDRAALDAVRRWRFIPARVGEERVAATVLVPLNFRLTD